MTNIKIVVQINDVTEEGNVSPELVVDLQLHHKVDGLAQCVDLVVQGALEKFRQDGGTV